MQMVGFILRKRKYCKRFVAFYMSQDHILTSIIGVVELHSLKVTKELEVVKLAAKDGKKIGAAHT